MKIWHNIYSDITTLEAIFQAWDGFIQGKKKKKDVVEFGRYLEDNLFLLNEELKNKTYKHGGYKSFYVRDPKVRHISKAKVRDRVVHHLVSSTLENVFDPTFYAYSYSCRKNKGTHKAVEKFAQMLRKASKNNTSAIYVLKCDIKKFFATVDQKILLQLLSEKIKDNDFLWLLSEIVGSFQSDYTFDLDEPKGMPIGNLTSQFFANIYLNPLDQFVKNELKIQYYMRYADDFVFLSEDQEYLKEVLSKIDKFLKLELKLTLHPDKIIISNYYLGIDFLGYIIFPYFIVPRTKTKRRIFRKINKKVQLFRENKLSYDSLNQALQSYLGYLSHADAYELSKELKNLVLYLMTN